MFAVNKPRKRLLLLIRISMVENLGQSHQRTEFFKVIKSIHNSVGGSGPPWGMRSVRELSLQD